MKFNTPLAPLWLGQFICFVSCYLWCSVSISLGGHLDTIGLHSPWQNQRRSDLNFEARAVCEFIRAGVNQRGPSFLGAWGGWKHHRLWWSMKTLLKERWRIYLCNKTGWFKETPLNEEDEPVCRWCNWLERIWHQEQHIHRASQGLTSETGKSYITVTEWWQDQSESAGLCPVVRSSLGSHCNAIGCRCCIKENQRIEMTWGGDKWKHTRR